METFYDICEAIGVGAAAGLSPLVAIAAIVIFVAANIGVNASNTDVSFIEGVAFVAIAAVVLVQSFIAIFTPGGVKVRVAADRPRMAWVHTGLSFVVGALGGAVVFNAEGHSLIVGSILGSIPAAVVAIAASKLLGGVVQRLDARAEQSLAKAKSKGDADATKSDAITSSRILAIGVDLATIAAAVLALVAPPFALILPLLATALIVGSRRREAKKHEGLRVLR